MFKRILFKYKSKKRKINENIKCLKIMYGFKSFESFVRDSKFENVNEKNIIKTLDLSIIEDLKDIEYIINKISK